MANDPDKDRNVKAYDAPERRSSGGMGRWLGIIIAVIVVVLLLIWIF